MWLRTRLDRSGGAGRRGRDLGLAATAALLLYIIGAIQFQAFL